MTETASSELSATTDCYLVFDGSPWLRIPCDDIERVDYPPFEKPFAGETRFLPIIRQAVRVLRKDGGVLWTSGNRAWYEQQKREQQQTAMANLINAQAAYNAACAR